MASEDDELKKKQIMDAKTRNISRNVRCTECGSQSIEDSQADIAVLWRKEEVEIETKVMGERETLASVQKEGKIVAKVVGKKGNGLSILIARTNCSVSHPIDQDLYSYWASSS